MSDPSPSVPLSLHLEVAINVGGMKSNTSGKDQGRGHPLLLCWAPLYLRAPLQSCFSSGAEPSIATCWDKDPRTQKSRLQCLSRVCCCASPPWWRGICSAISACASPLMLQTREGGKQTHHSRWWTLCIILILLGGLSSSSVVRE